jgi:hypothetical protein
MQYASRLFPWLSHFVLSFDLVMVRLFFKEESELDLSPMLIRARFGGNIVMGYTVWFFPHSKQEKLTSSLNFWSKSKRQVSQRVWPH